LRAMHHGTDDAIFRITATSFGVYDDGSGL
jgi:hypothetical protein